MSTSSSATTSSAMTPASRRSTAWRCPSCSRHRSSPTCRLPPTTKCATSFPPSSHSVHLAAYNLATKEWGAVRYPTDVAERGWVGLSEITLHGDHVYIIERDNLIGDAARIKKLYRVALSELKPAPLVGDLPLVTKQQVRDFIPDLKAKGGYVVDKVEGFAVDAAGTGYVVTDNDGVDDSNGETLFFSIGAMQPPA